MSPAMHWLSPSGARQFTAHCGEPYPVRGVSELEKFDSLSDDKCRRCTRQIVASQDVAAAPRGGRRGRAGARHKSR